MVEHEVSCETLAGTPAEVESAVAGAVHVDPHDLVIVAVPVDLSQPVRADRVVLDNLETPLPGLGDLVSLPTCMCGISFNLPLDIHPQSRSKVHCHNLAAYHFTSTLYRTFTYHITWP